MDPLRDILQLLHAGQFNDAGGACQAFLEQHPHHNGAEELLAQIHCQRGDFLQAAQLAIDAIAREPDNSRWHRNLGYVHFLAGDINASIASYRHALRLAPSDVELGNSLGVALKEGGETDEAIEIFQQIVREQPEFPLAQKNLADLLSRKQDFAEANRHYQLAVRQDPDDVESLIAWGLVLATQNRLALAATQFMEAIKRTPNGEEAHQHLDQLLRSVSDGTDTADPADQHSSRCEIARRLVLGTQAFSAQGRSQEAAALQRAAVLLDPQSYLAHYSLGVLLDLGRFDEAIEHLEQSIELAPESSLPYKPLGDLARQDQYKFTSRQWKRMQWLATSNMLSPKEAATLQFTLANLLDKQGNYDAAFRANKKGNQTQFALTQSSGARFDPAKQRAQYEAERRVYDKPYFESQVASGRLSDVPVFIVGMPRSGTTLVEQIIASHPEVTAAGELTCIKQLTRPLATWVDNGREYPDCVNAAKPEMIAELADRYLGYLAERGHTAARIIDKAPGNFIYLGFIATLFPAAHIIHCRRDPMDVCFSCYSCQFSHINWSWQMEDIGAFYRQYERLMEHWREVLPLRIHEVHYDQLVCDPAGESRALIEHCGLPWDDCCLEYHNNSNVVQTASRVQVRQPIYRSSVQRWKRYEEHLAPLRRALDG